MENKKAFTLIELMGVLVIIGILTVILIPVINNTIKNSKQELYDKQLESIKLSAKNLASDNEYILPEDNGDIIYITLGQLRIMGYAEEEIINPLTKENFSDDLIILIIKREKDYDYEVEIEGKEIVFSSGITVSKPSKKYVKQGNQSSYIITAKTSNTIDNTTTEYYIELDKSNIIIKGTASTEQIKYKLDGNNGLYKLTLAGGKTEGTLYFNFDNLKGLEGNDIDTSEINKELDTDSNKQIIVDNTAPVITYSINETKVWKKSVGTKIEVIDNNGVDALDSDTYKYIYSLSNEKEQELTKIYNLEDEVKQESGDGEYYLIAQACDKAENCVQKVSGKYLVDNTNPTCNWSGENEIWTNNSVTVTLTGTDNHKINDSKKTYTKTYNGSGVEISTENLSYEIEDEAGNKTSCTKNVNVYYDTKAPVITNTYNPGGNWVNYDFSVSITASENGSGFNPIEYYSYDNSNWYTESWIINNNTLTTQPYSAERNDTLYLKVCDKLENCSQTSTTIKIDKTAPSISVSVGDCSNNTRPVTINASDSLSGIAGYNITSSSSTPSSFNSSTSGSYSSGTYYAWAKDNAGNIASQSFTVGTCITAADICAADEDTLFGTSKGNISGNYGSWYIVPSSWGSTWCNGRCNPSGGYQRICSSSSCSYYEIYGLTAWQINDTYGCKFAKLWCSCS